METAITVLCYAVSAYLVIGVVFVAVAAWKFWKMK